MASNKIMAYCYYQQQYPGAVIFFRVGDNYEVYQEDAGIVAQIIDVQTEISGTGHEAVASVRFPVGKGHEYALLLTRHNITVKMISQRNEAGSFDVPDVDQIESDRESDY
jgi:DNA mismatch repair ATPase MutS